jgi:hypothetical protein
MERKPWQQKAGTQTVQKIPVSSGPIPHKVGKGTKKPADFIAKAIK